MSRFVILFEGGLHYELQGFDVPILHMLVVLSLTFFLFFFFFFLSFPILVVPWCLHVLDRSRWCKINHLDSSLNYSSCLMTALPLFFYFSFFFSFFFRFSFVFSPSLSPQHARRKCDGLCARSSDRERLRRPSAPSAFMRPVTMECLLRRLPRRIIMSRMTWWPSVCLVAARLLQRRSAVRLRCVVGVRRPPRKSLPRPCGAGDRLRPCARVSRQQRQLTPAPLLTR